jgi:hypothetical protein
MALELRINTRLAPERIEFRLSEFGVLTACRVNRTFRLLLLPMRKPFSLDEYIISPAMNAAFATPRGRCCSSCKSCGSAEWAK